jgi:preprotein translocase subunit SecG
MFSIVLTVHVMVSIVLIGLILMQQGKGAEAGASFGAGGASGTVFGADGSGSFLTRLTGILAASFFATSLMLAVLSGNKEKPKDLMEQMTEGQAIEVIESDVPGTNTVPSELENDVPFVDQVDNTDNNVESSTPTSDVPE